MRQRAHSTLVHQGAKAGLKNGGHIKTPSAYSTKGQERPPLKAATLSSLSPNRIINCEYIIPKSWTFTEKAGDGLTLSSSVLQVNKIAAF
ncbi:hypothetical protein FACS1894122_01880 [Alphaproteobacteria bacterium]|nr:hypothetical protein FACS1894122_01880 [Alphaproteobacteria bacterium]